jgi:hypothetical protein
MSELNREEMQSALFVQLVMQQANMAMMLLGKLPNPETGKTMRELEAAQVFIDQLEMIEAKTKGNLNPQEAALLKQTLMSLRMAFVEAVNEPAAKTEEAKPVEDKPADGANEKSPPAESVGEDDSSKRFSKKYSL